MATHAVVGEKIFVGKNYCICEKPYQEGEFMIECSICNNWFHGKCVLITEENSAYIDQYHCPKCKETHGPLIWLKLKCTIFFYFLIVKMLSILPKNVRTGSKKFMEKLKTRKFLSAEDIPVISLHGSELTFDYLEKHSFDNPILSTSTDGLHLQTPPTNFSAQAVEDLVGPMQEISVIDVARQEDHRMFLREWTNYFTNQSKKKILNLLSLEFSNSKLSELVTPPQIVFDVSWVTNMWPNDETMYLKPEVQKYCLMSVEDSYTDFHIDFGGTSVWYHVVRGEKIFYLIKPTPSNLAEFETWMKSSEQPMTFFADIVTECYQVKIKQGETVFLPSGWIHAVWTPKESLVFGGNFLNSFNTDIQLQIYNLEKRILAPNKYLFPNFEPLHWFVASSLTSKVKDLLERNQRLPKYLIESLKAMLPCLRVWSRDKEVDWRMVADRWLSG
ncbi:hypothetical protein HELRODRAFT_88624 [Helobdella robusta]|uniref:Uncharacterized protein n=1 Tax=Helobdella robusta TaxID=6412 RepID=T1G745_HELRO|nr:hypothetical protein HELRODRAFT_88624 [Helobdella robusta]ESN93539.1 hypothetical protein HELRODRAFT_88624 [Helobdella robusta]